MARGPSGGSPTSRTVTSGEALCVLRHSQYARVQRNSSLVLRTAADSVDDSQTCSLNLNVRFYVNRTQKVAYKAFSALSEGLWPEVGLKG